MGSQKTLTHTATKYLQAIDTLQTTGKVHQIDVAKYLKVSPSSCFESILRLIKKELITQDNSKCLALTPEGKKVLAGIQQNQYIFASFFREVLGECCQDSKKIASQIEPILDLDTTLTMCRFNNFLEHIKGRKVDFWKEWADFCLDPTKDEPCLECAHRDHCLKTKKQKPD